MIASYIAFSLAMILLTSAIPQNPTAPAAALLPYGERRAILESEGALQMDAPMSKPLWLAPADPAYFKEREFVQSAIDEAPQRVYAVDLGRVTALEADLGNVAWRRTLGAGGPLVVLGDTLVVTSGDRLVGIDRHTVTIAWIAPAGVSFLTTAKNELFVRAGEDVARVGSDGRVLWRHAVSDPQSAFVAGSHLIVVGSREIVVLSAADGILESRIEGHKLLGSDGHLAIVDLTNESVNNLDARVIRLVDLSSGAVLAERSLEVGTRTFRYIEDRAAFDHGAAYVSAGDFVYRIALEPGYQAVALPRFGRWVGGPYRGNLYFERYDGLWRVEPRSDRLAATRLLAYEPSVRQIAALAFDGDALEVGFFGGRFFIVNPEQRSLLLSGHLPCVGYYGFAASGKTALALCDVRSKAHLGFIAAFPRFWPHA